MRRNVKLGVNLDYFGGGRRQRYAVVIAMNYKALVESSWDELRTDVGRYALPRFGPRAGKYLYIHKFDSPQAKGR